MRYPVWLRVILDNIVGDHHRRRVLRRFLRTSRTNHITPEKIRASLERDARDPVYMAKFRAGVKEAEAYLASLRQDTEQ